MIMKPFHLLNLLLCIVLFFLISSPIFAIQNIRVVALFNDQVMVEIDGRRTLLKVGKPTKDGVALISADFEEAVIRVDGHQETFNLSDRVSSSFSAARSLEARIKRHASGAYLMTGNINGKKVSMMVDTGATFVALSEKEARRLKIPYLKKGTRIEVQTASGRSAAWEIKLNSVKVGEIELRSVGAVVIKGDSPQHVLLGMTFLGQLEMNNKGNLMVLRKR